ncbi:hypothetical protein DMN91_006501 [Ooceraea biroi]|uniref:Short-chain dehydrogenase/reductase family 16C member n=1 Tax=Ooceraea biroi TaxID=2015173 RepID=A0A3L8DP01_OOCBI|nr:hypothetical protein DMN91_006501 [Ooceraea biroi]
MEKIQHVFTTIKLPRLILDLCLLSIKISLAMIVATFRMIVPRSLKYLLGETVLVYGFVVDISKRLEVQETMRLMKRIDVPDVTILINNAAVLYHKPYLNYNPDDVENTFKVNVFSNFWTIEVFLPMMLHRGSGHIVAISSMCGIYGVSQKVAYCSSKFAVRGLMEALHEEIRLDKRKPNIHFTTIYPFYIDTGLAEDPKYR